MRVTHPDPEEWGEESSGVGHRNIPDISLSKIPFRSFWRRHVCFGASIWRLRIFQLIE